MRYKVLRGAFAALSLSGVSPLVRALSGVRGVIFTLHRVLPGAPSAFAPNAILQVTPAFLEAAIIEARRAGFDIVTLDEAIARLAAPERGRPFVVFTFDDAYRDNLNFALPVLRRYEAPFTLFVPTALVDGVGEVWWQALEDIVAANDAIALDLEEGPMRFAECRSVAEKNAVYNALYTLFRTMPEARRVAAMAELAARYRFDLAGHCRDLVMDWSELKIFVRDPLCTIGAHTVRHYELSKLSAGDARNEMDLSAQILAGQTGERPRHFSYPIGSTIAAGPREYALARDLGFASAVTTRPGGLYPEYARSPWDLPRISLNGLFQNPRFLSVFLTGLYFTLQSGGRTKFGATPQLPARARDEKKPLHRIGGEGACTVARKAQSSWA